MSFSLHSILVCPKERLPLEFNSSLQQFICLSEGATRAYKVVDNIPIMVGEAKTEATSAIHTAQGSVFHYVDHYEKDSQVFDYFQIPDDPATAHENRRLHEFILSKAPRSVESVLDIGCGNGWVAKHFAKRGKNIVSFDISLDNIQRVLKENPSPTHYGVKGDVLALPFQDEAFDLIISAEVIEHVPDTASYLSNITTALKKGGRAIISTPYNEKLQYSLCIHCNRSTPLHAHIHSFREDSIDHVVKAIPGVSVRAFTMSNKGLLFLRTYKLLQYLPFSIWRAVDKMANVLINKPARLIYVLDKDVK